MMSRQVTNEQLARRYWEANAANDFDALAALRHKDWVLDWPQSGERIRGHDNDVAIHSRYPGGLPSGTINRIVGSEDRWVVTPSFTVQRVAGGGDFWWAEGLATYPDGARYHYIGIIELRDSKVWRERGYFASSFDPPEWRAAWVERI